MAEENTQHTTKEGDRSSTTDDVYLSRANSVVLVAIINRLRLTIGPFDIFVDLLRG
ncbi:hypothetical protein EUX98_g6786 [Antrodiella citrinella]|uniref:Uncharacterized protein n=1 Tax=Antrodiella citrinella TaxID=2447956 RepID=A0A4S4MVL8_9APHY|nr:hypothetical protein EUX98_g6786 [Antrodiella citrinella]